MKEKIPTRGSPEISHVTLYQISNAEYQIKTFFTGFRSRKISGACDSSWCCEGVGEEQGGADPRCGCGDRLCGPTGNPSG